MAAICLSSLRFTIYNSMCNLHSLLILCFIGLAVVFEALFTKAIYIILKMKSQHRLFGIEPGLVWPALALFGMVWCSNTQALPANALVQILSLSSSTGPPPYTHPPLSKKFLGGVKVVASKSDILQSPCELLLREPICHMEKEVSLTHRDFCTYTQRHAEVGEMTNYPLCESVCCEAMSKQHTRSNFI